MSAPNWPGLFKWAARYSDGTDPSAFNSMSDQDKQWLTDALQDGVVDNVQRMRAIQAFLSSSNNDEKAISEKADLLEELVEIVENIDFARDLHKIGGLQTLITLLGSPHAALRWRAAEVVGMAVQSNEPVQEWFLQGNVLPPVLALLHDTDATCRAKGLLALSCLVRHSNPALQAFYSSDGMAELSRLLYLNAPKQAAAGSHATLSVVDAQTAGGASTSQQQADVRQLRKALQLLTYIAQEDSQQTSTVLKDDEMLPCLRHCMASQDQDVRQWCLQLLTASCSCRSGIRRLQQEVGLVEQLQKRLRRLSALDVEDLSSFQEELTAIESLLSILEKATSANTHVNSQHQHPQASQPARDMQLAAI